MTLDGTLALLFFLGSSWCALLSMVLHYEIVVAINQKRTGEKPLDCLGFFPRPTSSWTVFSIYRSCYPNGNLLRRYWLVIGGELLCFALTVLFLYRTARP